MKILNPPMLSFGKWRATLSSDKNARRNIEGKSKSKGRKGRNTKIMTFGRFYATVPVGRGVPVNQSIKIKSNIKIFKIKRKLRSKVPKS